MTCKNNPDKGDHEGNPCRYCGEEVPQRTGRLTKTEPNIQNLPDTLADKLDKAIELGHIGWVEPSTEDEISDEAYIQRARQLWADDDLEIDDVTETSRADAGAWVRAWVWVANSEFKNDEEAD